MPIIFLLTGLLAGVFGGFFGVGGGVVMIPVLTFFLGFSQKMAQGTTIAAMIPPIGLLAALAYWKTGNVDIKAAAFIAAGFFIGGFLGGSLAQHLPETVLKKAFALLLVVIAVKIWLSK